MDPWAFKQQLARAFAEQPCLAIDVGAEAIWVMNPKTGARIGSARLSQVTATPETSVVWRGKFCHRLPVLAVCVAGLPAVRITCLEAVRVGFGTGLRFSWRGESSRRSKVAQRVYRPASYMVAGAEWLTLVEKFGLTTYLADRKRRARG